MEVVGLNTACDSDFSVVLSPVAKQRISTTASAYLE